MTLLKTKKNIKGWLKKLFLVVVPPLLRILAKVLVKEASEDKSFLIPGYTGLGNFVLKTPFIKALREKYPDTRIDILCGNSYGTEFVLADSSWIDETLIFPVDSTFIKQTRFYWGMRGRYNTIFLFFDTSVPHLYCGSILAGIPNRIGHAGLADILEPIREACLTQAVSIRKNTHEVDLNFDLLESVFEPRRTYTQYVSVPNSYSSQVDRIINEFGIKNGNYVLLQLSAASGGPTPKVWPGEYFRQLIKLLMDKGTTLIAVGDSKEKMIADDILVPFNKKVLNLVGKTRISDIALLIKNSRGILCHDSGLMHVGNALKTPLIAIGSGDYAKTRPLAATSHVVKLDLPCAPCLGLNGYWSESEALEKCPNEMRCMSEITPQMVFEKAVEVFGL